MTRSTVRRLVALARRNGDDAGGTDEPDAADDPVAGTDVDSGGTLLTRAAVSGLVGGFIATVVMTGYRLPVFRALPPTAEFWAQYVGGEDAEDYPVEGLLLHLLYGVGGGVVFGPAYAVVASRLPVRRDATGMVSGVVYGLSLSLFGERVIFERLLERDLDSERALVFHAGHLVYGLTLGTWLGTRERRGDVYDRPSEHADE